MVRLMGLEPTRRLTQPPQDCASAIPPQPHTTNIITNFLLKNNRLIKKLTDFYHLTTIESLSD